jgi:hypothetical protein
MISYHVEYEAPNLISWFPKTTSGDDLHVVTINTTLRCDVHNGSGYEFTSSSTQEYFIQQVPSYVIQEAAINVNHGHLSATHFAQLQQFAKSNNISPMEYTGAGPTDIATCYAHHTFVAKTSILSLPKKASITSLPFNYVWYNTAR